jgi:hypothetical protein
MPVELSHQNVRDLAKKLRELTGREIKHTVIIEAIAEALGRRPDAMMHELKGETLSSLEAGKGDPAFEFPRDPRSNYDHIYGDAIRESTLRLISGYEEKLKNDRDIQAILANKGGGMVTNVLRIAASFAFMKGIDPKNDYDAALVMQALADFDYPSTGAVDIETRTLSPVSQARDLAEANGFRLRSNRVGFMVFGMLLNEEDLPGGDTATLEVLVTVEGGTTVNAGPNDKVWFASMTYKDPRGSNTVAGGGPKLSTLHDAIGVALGYKNEAKRVWAERYDLDEIEAFVSSRRPNSPKL